MIHSSGTTDEFQPQESSPFDQSLITLSQKMSGQGGIDKDNAVSSISGTTCNGSVLEACSQFLHGMAYLSRDVRKIDETASAMLIRLMCQSYLHISLNIDRSIKNSDLNRVDHDMDSIPMQLKDNGIVGIMHLWRESQHAAIPQGRKQTISLVTLGLMKVFSLISSSKDKFHIAMDEVHHEAILHYDHEGVDKFDNFLISWCNIGLSGRKAQAKEIDFIRRDISIYDNDFKKRFQFHEFNSNILKKYRDWGNEGCIPMLFDIAMKDSGYDNAFNYGLNVIGSLIATCNDDGKREIFKLSKHITVNEKNSKSLQLIASEVVLCCHDQSVDLFKNTMRDGVRDDSLDNLIFQSTLERIRPSILSSIQEINDKMAFEKFFSLSLSYEAKDDDFVFDFRLRGPLIKSMRLSPHSKDIVRHIDREINKKSLEFNSLNTVMKGASVYARTEFHGLKPSFSLSLIGEYSIEDARFITDALAQSQARYCVHHKYHHEISEIDSYRPTLTSVLYSVNSDDYKIFVTKDNPKRISHRVKSHMSIVSILMKSKNDDRWLSVIERFFGKDIWKSALPTQWLCEAVDADMERGGFQDVVSAITRKII